MAENVCTCRCCGNVYDLEPYGGYVGYSICPACCWEEDFEEEDQYSDCNGMSLREYRKDFLKNQALSAMNDAIDIVESEDHTLEDTNRVIAHTRLYLALCECAKGRLNEKADYGKQDFYPLKYIKSLQELHWTLDYIANTYQNRVKSDTMTGEKYMILVDDVPAGHPVYLIGTLYVLMLAGAEIHVCFGEYQNSIDNRILESLTAQGVVQRFTPNDPYDSEELIKYISKKKLGHLVCLGDAANTHEPIPIARRSGVSSLHYPSAHLLIADYKNSAVFTEKHKLFSDQCWQEIIDYSGYRAPTNEDADVYLGFDFGDLFWGADTDIKAWNNLACMKEKVPTVFFTDRPRDQVWKPEGIEQCCNIVFFDDYDCRYPLYDFTQLISAT